jgi:hypothetical protein
MVRQWYDRPQSADWGASPAEWAWFCWRTKGRRVDEARRAEEAKGKPVVKGATAGWRQEKRVDVPAEPPPTTLPRATVGR